MSERSGVTIGPSVSHETLVHSAVTLRIEREAKTAVETPNSPSKCGNGEASSVSSAAMATLVGSLTAGSGVQMKEMNAATMTAR